MTERSEGEPMSEGEYLQYGYGDEPTQVAEEAEEVQMDQYLRRMEPAAKDSASFPRRAKEGHVRKVRTQCVQWSIPAPPSPSLPSTFPKPPLETPVVG